MKSYAATATISATFEIEAASKEEADRILRPILEGGRITVVENADNEESVSGTCRVEGEIDFR